MDTQKKECEFVLLPPYLVGHRWDQIRDVLSRADDPSMLIDDIEGDVFSGNNIYDFWVYLKDNEIKYIFLCHVQGTCYFVDRVSGGGKYNPWELATEAFKNRGAYLGCTSVLFMGTKAWGKILEPLGVKVHQYVYSVPTTTSEVNN